MKKVFIFLLLPTVLAFSQSRSKIKPSQVQAMTEASAEVRDFGILKGKEIVAKFTAEHMKQTAKMEKEDYWTSLHFSPIS
jgi:hypothetical protein